MSGVSFNDAALLLVGHGSTVNDDSSRTVYQHAATLRRRGLFAEVREGFWKIEPRITSVLATLSANRVFVVPLFTCRGYFTQEIIPRALGFRADKAVNRRRLELPTGQTLFYCDPVGSHPRMTDVVLKRAQEVLGSGAAHRTPSARQTALIIVGHGTERNANSRLAVDHQVERIRGLDLYAEVSGAFLEEAPRVADCASSVRSKHLVVVPFFVSEGLHVNEDIPVLLGAVTETVRQRRQQGLSPWTNPTERDGRWVWYARSVGSHPAVADLIVELVVQRAVGGAAPC